METRNVNITPGGQPPIIHVSQNDVGRAITLNVSDGTGWYDLTGCSVALAGVKPSGLGFTIAGTVSGHTVTITTEKLMTSEYGNIACELKITKGDVKIGTANMILAVEKDPHPEHTTDGNVDELIPEITILVERIEAAVEKAEVLFESEAWARGTRDGVPVDEEDPTYHNNSKWYKESVEWSAVIAEGWATGKHNGEDVESTDPAYHNNAKYYSEQAAESEVSAADSSASAANRANAAADAASSAEASAAAAARVLAQYGDITISLNADDNGIDLTLTTT